MTTPPNVVEAKAKRSEQPTRRWRVIAWLGWFAAMGAIAHVGLALLWPDDLSDTRGALHAVHYLAFMARVFLFHAGAAMLLVIAFALFTRRLRLGIVAAMPAMVVALPLVPSLTRGGSSAPTRAASSDELSILSINTMYGEADATTIQQLVKTRRPDVIVFQEWTTSARRSYLHLLQPEYPHVSEVVRDDAFGQAVLSRRVFAEPPTLYPPLPGMREPQITFAVQVGGRPMRVTNVHLLPPIGLRYFAEQRSGARALSTWARSAHPNSPHVLIGDFNAPAGTAILNAFLEGGWSEAHAAAGFGRGSTWPGTGILRHLPGVRLDNAAVAPGLIVTSAFVAQPIGSDHRPIMVTVRWAEDKAP